MRISALLSASVAVLALGAAAAIETVADDYDRAPTARKPDPTPVPAAKVDSIESLRGRIARMDRERRDRRRAEVASRAAENANPVHRRNEV